MNFSISSWSIGAGLAYQICEAIRLDLGYMTTIYDKDVTAVGEANGMEFKDVYNRTSNAWGIGLNFKFGK